MDNVSDRWSSGGEYESFIGRWSRLVAAAFLDRLAVRPAADWLDLGCGTGALTDAILTRCEPRSVVGVDPSPDFVSHARSAIADPRARFAVGTADRTGLADRSVDVVASGLVLNFVPDLQEALAETWRIIRPGGAAAGYVWDYADGMELLRRFWDAAAALDPAARRLDEGVRFPNAAPGPLVEAFRAAGFDAIEVWPIEVPTPFADFDDLWTPFLGGIGPAPGYVSSLDEPACHALRDRLRASLPIEADGTIALSARAWAVRGRRTGSTR